MIRKAIIVALTLAALVVAFAWAWSYDDQELDAYLGGYDSYVVTRGPDVAVYVTSLRGWLRAGVLRMDPEQERPAFIGMSSGFWGVVRYPIVRVDGRFGHRSRLGGLLVTCDYSFPYARLICAAVPHYAVFVALIAYPVIALVGGPLRQWRRRRRGLCLKCGYNTTGNETGACPECGNTIPLP